MKRHLRLTARRGFVLIIALGALAVMTVLLLALLNGGAHQIRDAQSDAAYAREKMLADTAVAQVIGQIQQASTQNGVAWISQPGLIRTFGAATRTPIACYKLYSAAPPVDTSGGLAFLASDVPQDWNSSANQSVFVDLNAPQQTPGLLGTSIYPILDPAALTSIQGVSSDTGGVAMPVMWLYELQDGSLGPAGNATKANPIVGRIAWWTDDDSCKIDLNTAGCGAPWNTPRLNSTDDVAWSTTQPATGEFSRYPGHPAMTSLAPIFSFGPQGIFTTGLSPGQLLGLTPRYAVGGSNFGAQATTPGESVPPKTDRLYGSLDELAFGTTLTGSGQRAPGPITPAQLNQARFVLTAHSVSPETTLLGEPRIAIWPVSTAPSDPTRTTPDDRAIESAATVGAGSSATPRDYFFQRNDPLNPAGDLAIPSNTQLFDELLARGGETIPGYGVNFQQKYAGAKWAQLMIEIADFIRGLNAVDPTPAPFVPFAHPDPATNASVHGLGRCPTLSSLTLVFYVCGFGFSISSHLPPVDFETMSNADAAAYWTSNFNLSSPTNNWHNVTSELIRAFVVPTTFHPGCGYPEVSDACSIQIQGLNSIGIASPTSNDFGFPSSAGSSPLGTPFSVLTPDRAWGGNEGPIPWRQTGDALASGSSSAYPFAGTQSFTLPLLASPTYYAPTHILSLAPSPSLAFKGATLTVQFQDTHNNILQTIQLNFPSASPTAPSIEAEADHSDGATPQTAVANWSSNAANTVLPCYYMKLANRLLATQGNRSYMIQPGDVTRTIEATDARLVAATQAIPTGSNLFQTMCNYRSSVPQNHNIHFADGTAACGAGTSSLIGQPYASLTASATGTSWETGQPAAVSWYTSPACSAPVTSIPSYVTMTPGPGRLGDWDSGPGFGPDGAMINLPDAGTSLAPATAYFTLAGRSNAPGAAFLPTRFSPNALVPSPVIFGSLPAGIDPGSSPTSTPWRTLLFCPNPAAGFLPTPPAQNAITSSMHPGVAWPPDYLLLDNFWMPTVEPYAISTCMATAGKINLNDQIAPFTYLHRNTAFHALLDDLRIPALPNSLTSIYKKTGAPLTSPWLAVDETATIAQLENRFAAGDAYLTEGEVCSVPLVPQGATAANLAGFWNAHALTGDNLRELPYAQLYSRLTTRSNSYTVHVHVQVLQKLPGDPQQNVWKEGTDIVLGDWRGSYEIERDLDPAASPPAAATATTPGQPLGPYRFRIVSSQRFSP